MPSKPSCATIPRVALFGTNEVIRSVRGLQNPRSEIVQSKFSYSFANYISVLRKELVSAHTIPLPHNAWINPLGRTCELITFPNRRSG